MQMSLIVAAQVLVMFILAGIGYLMFRRGKITLEGNRTIGNILIYLSLPAVIIKGFQVERTAGNTEALLVSALAGIAIVFVGGSVARIFLKDDPVECFAGTFSNPSFFGIPLVASVLGQGAVFYMTGFIAAMNIGQWTYGIGILKGERARLDIRSILSAPFLIAAAIGLVLYFSAAALPDVLQNALDFVAAVNTPLAMFSVGVYLAETDLHALLGKNGAYKVAAVRLVAVPLAVIACLSVLPQEFFAVKMALLIAQACPVASMVAVYSQLYGNDYAHATETIVISVLLSIITIPVMVGLAQIVWL